MCCTCGKKGVETCDSRKKIDWLKPIEGRLSTYQPSWFKAKRQRGDFRTASPENKNLVVMNGDKQDHCVIVDEYGYNGGAQYVRNLEFKDVWVVAWLRKSGEVEAVTYYSLPAFRKGDVNALGERALEVQKITYATN